MKWKQAQILEEEKKWIASLKQSKSFKQLDGSEQTIVHFRLEQHPEYGPYFDKGNGWVLLKLCDNDGEALMLYQGNDGGALTFHPCGVVGVVWNYEAALASAHGTGNRKRRVTVSTGKRKPPKASYLFERIQEYRLTSLEFERVGHPLPKSSNEPGVAELLSDELRQPAWTMMSAVLNGDAATLRKIADLVEFAEKIRLDNGDFTPIKSWEEISEAISNAAMKAGKPPTREAVYKELYKLNPNVSMDSLIGNLGRMGFGWLAGKAGRPRKPVTEKPTKGKNMGRKRVE